MTDRKGGACVSVPGPARAGRTLALVAGGLMLGVILLAGSLPAAGPPAPPGGSQLGGARAEHADGHLGAVFEREVCADGSDPAALSMRPSSAEGDAVRRIRERGELIVGVDQNSYLWGYREPDTGEIVGFDIDLVRAIAADLLGEQPRVVFRAIPTDQRERLLQEREVDLVVRSVSITCARWEQIAFSIPYFEAGQQLLAPRHSGIEGLDGTLDGARVCTGEDTTARRWMETESAALGAEPVAADGHLDCLVLIQLGEADALMTDNALAAGHAAQDPSVRLVGEPLNKESYGVGMHLEDVDLVRRVNAVLLAYQEEGENSAWRQSFDYWLGDWMDDTSPEPPSPRYRD